ncbi:hypothetical protein IWQ60_000647 [Tieghemiomyces parasiticus]|uniref:Cyclin N-terminal domain-containing protein n=1 Tax=Tieghemiomyces parasiticus TaxID=78921 RepID=A0A9W8E2M7_9FUNG|nr:hypothetical protein IWQ60_000647 [Tieghemiomyces parasiticus]
MVTQTQPPPPPSSTAAKDQRWATERRAFKNNLRADVIAIAEQMVNWLFACSPVEGDKPTSSKTDSAGGPNSLPSLGSFIRSVVHRTQTPVTAIITALIYLCRLKQRHPSCKGSPGAGHRLILAALITATKSLYDDAYHNRSWVTVSQGLFNLAEVNQMEMEFLVFLNFRLCVTRDQWCEFVAIIDEKLQSHWSRTGLLQTYRNMGFSLIAEVIDNPVAQRGEQSVDTVATPVSVDPTITASETHPHLVAPLAAPVHPLPSLSAVVTHVRAEAASGKPYSPLSSCVTPTDVEPRSSAAPIKLFRKASDNSFHSLPSSSEATSGPPFPADARAPHTPNSPVPPPTTSISVPEAASRPNLKQPDSGPTQRQPSGSRLPPPSHAPSSHNSYADLVPPSRPALSQATGSATSSTQSTPRAFSGLASFGHMLKSKASAGSLCAGNQHPMAHPTPMVDQLPPPPRSVPSAKSSHRFSPAGFKITQRLKALSFLRPSHKMNGSSKHDSGTAVSSTNVALPLAPGYPQGSHADMGPSYYSSASGSSHTIGDYASEAPVLPYPGGAFIQPAAEHGYHGPHAQPQQLQHHQYHHHQPVYTSAYHSNAPTVQPGRFTPQPAPIYATGHQSQPTSYGSLNAPPKSAEPRTMAHGHQNLSLPTRTKNSRQLSWPHLFNLSGPAVAPNGVAEGSR